MKKQTLLPKKLTLILIIITPLVSASMIANHISSKLNICVPFPTHSNLLPLA